jgi:hypothetical protein
MFGNLRPSKWSLNAAEPHFAPPPLLHEVVVARISGT